MREVGGDGPGWGGGWAWQGRGACRGPRWAAGEGANVGRMGGEVGLIFEPDKLLCCFFFYFFLHIHDKYYIYRFFSKNNGYSAEYS